MLRHKKISSIHPDHSSVSSTKIGVRAGRNFFWMLVSEGMAKVMVMAMTIYIARILSPSSYGVYAVAHSVALYLAALVLFGTGNYGQRQIAQSPREAFTYYSEIMGLRLILASVVFGIFILVIFLLPLPQARKEFFLAALVLPVGLGLKPDWVFRGIEKIHYLFLGNFVLAVVLCVGILLTVKGPEDTLFAILFRGGSVVLASIVLTVSLFRIIPDKFVITFKKNFFHLKESVFFGFTVVLQAFINELVILIGGFFLADKALGFYAAPHRIAVTLAWIGMMFGFGFYPVLSSTFVQSSEKFRRSFLLMVRGSFLIAAPVLLVGMLFAPQIVTLLLGQAYERSGFLMLVLLPVFLIDCLHATFSFGLMAAGKQKYQTIALFVGFFIMLVSGFVFIPHFLGTGAACAYLLGKSVYLIILIWVFFKKVGVYFPDLKFFIPFVLIVVLAAFTYLIPVEWMVKAVLSLMIYTAAVFLLKLISFSQIKELAAKLLPK